MRLKMGSACCVAARDGTLSNRNRLETFHRNAIYSPSWSCQWDRERRMAVGIENPSYKFSCESSGGSSLGMKSEVDLDRSNFSGGGSPLEHLGILTSQKSPNYGGLVAHRPNCHSDLSMASGNNSYSEVLSSLGSPETVITSAPQLSFSLPSASAFSTPNEALLPSRTLSLPANSGQSKREHSPGSQLLRQISDSRVLGSKSPNSNSISEGQASFVLSTCGNDSITGSCCGSRSSDGWSMQTFSELVASTQRGRWSFDSECIGSGRGKITESSSGLSCSPSIDPQTCGVCSKLLTERSSRSYQKIMSSNELSVVAVLFCGHVYHADCLDCMTPEADKYDPSCPICTFGEKQMSKISRKVVRAEAELKARSNQMFKSRVMDSQFDAELEFFECVVNTRREVKVPKMEASPSVRSSFVKPFLRRHFSVGSKWSRSLSENDSPRKKGFWTRYR